MRGFNQESNLNGVYLRKVPIVAVQKIDDRGTRIRQGKRVIQMRWSMPKLG